MLEIYTVNIEKKKYQSVQQNFFKSYKLYSTHSLLIFLLGCKVKKASFMQSNHFSITKSRVMSIRKSYKLVYSS